MKRLELNLYKKILIIEPPDLDFSVEKVIIALGDSERYIAELLDETKDLQFICNGSELTDEIAERLVEFKWNPIWGAIDYKNTENHFTTALESFISGIEAQGYYWGKNPIEKPEQNCLNKSFFTMQQNFHKEVAFEEAESRTFNPEKTLIFEIL